jgi:hypothetical protein
LNKRRQNQKSKERQKKAVKKTQGVNRRTAIKVKRNLNRIRRKHQTLSLIMIGQIEMLLKKEKRRSRKRKYS